MALESRAVHIVHRALPLDAAQQARQLALRLRLARVCAVEKLAPGGIDFGIGARIERPDYPGVVFQGRIPRGRQFPRPGTKTAVSNSAPPAATARRPVAQLVSARQSSSSARNQRAAGQQKRVRLPRKSRGSAISGINGRAHSPRQQMPRTTRPTRSRSTRRKSQVQLPEG